MENNLPKYDISGFGFSDKGKIRETNEDFYLIDQALGLYVLCDGEGGRGDVAGQTCARVVCDFIRQRQDVILQYGHNPGPEGRTRVRQVIQQALESANEVLLNEARNTTSARRLASTAEVLVILPDYAVLGHIGDSRAYLVRGKIAHQLTEDHKLGAEMIKKGLWDVATAARSPRRNQLTHALGYEKSPQVDLLEVEFTAGDVFVLCSDGLSEYFRLPEIRDFVEAVPTSDLAVQLVNAANLKGGSDNITTIVVKVEAHGVSTIKPLDVLEKQEAIGKVSLFVYLSFAELSKILALAVVRKLSAGALLFREGDASDTMVIVVSGKAEVRKDGQVIATLLQGATAGEMGIIDDSPRSATVNILQDTTVLSIGRSSLIKLLKRDPTLAVKILWALTQELDGKLRNTSRQLAEAKSTIEKSESVELPFEIDLGDS